MCEILKFSIYLSYFLIAPVVQADKLTGFHPLCRPTQSGTFGYSLSLSHIHQRMMLELRLEAGEEKLLLAGGGDARDKFGAVAGNEFVRRCHVEDKLAADKFGGGIIGVGADERAGMRFRVNRQSRTVIGCRANGRRESQGGENHGYALYLDGHADNG